MRNVSLFTDTPLDDYHINKFKLEAVPTNGNGDHPDENEFIEYSADVPASAVGALERSLEKNQPEINYTLVIDKRTIPIYKYILIELPDDIGAEQYTNLTGHIMEGATTIFPGEIEVGDVMSLPNQTPEQVLSIVITKEEDTHE